MLISGEKEAHKNKIIEQYLITGIYILFLLQDPLAGYWGISIFAQFDEILAIISIFAIFVQWSRIHFRLIYKKNLIRAISAFLSLVLVGVLSNLATQYQSLPFVFLDILTCSKMYIGITCACSLFPHGLAEKTKKSLSTITVLFICVYFILAMHDFLFPPLLSVLYDGGLKCIALAYSNVTYLAGYGIVLFSVLFLTRKYQKHFVLLALLSSITVCLTFRSKAMGFLCCAWMLYLTLRKGNAKQSENKLILTAPFVLAGMLLIAWDKISLYFFTESHYSPRDILLNIAMDLAREHFPLGTGFGTFCSVASLSNISPIYGKYGYNYFAAVYDMFWGCLIGQFGVLGTICFVISIIFIGFAIWKKQNKCKETFFCGLFLLLYLCIASLGECSFFSPYSIGYGFLIGISIQEVEEVKNE